LWCVLFVVSAVVCSVCCVFFVACACCLFACLLCAVCCLLVCVPRKASRGRRPAEGACGAPPGRAPGGPRGVRGEGPPDLSSMHHTSLLAAYLYITVVSILYRSRTCCCDALLQRRRRLVALVQVAVLGLLCASFRLPLYEMAPFALSADVGHSMNSIPPSKSRQQVPWRFSRDCQQAVPVFRVQTPKSPPLPVAA
jgi:hypothetical protein